MATRKKRLKEYHPRDSHLKILSKQKLSDLEHLISIDVGTFLVLLEEGTEQQISIARQKAKTALMKYGPDMNHIAAELAGQYPDAVENFLISVDDIVHTMTGWIDSALLKQCYQATQKLEKLLHKKN